MSLDPKWTALGIPVEKQGDGGDPLPVWSFLVGLLFVGVVLLVGWLA